MDNENKEFDLETRETEPWSDDVEFDPTESDEFYSNLEAAIGIGEEETKIPEVLTEEDPFEKAEEGKSETYSKLEEDLFAGVDAALAKQIDKEFGKAETGATVEKKQNRFLAVWREIPTWTKTLVSVILVVLISVGLLFGTSGGKKLISKVIVGILFDQVKEDEPDELITPEPEYNLTVTPDPNTDPDPTTEPEEDLTVTPGPTATPTPSIKLMDDEDVINVLLLGEENIYGAKRGRTDVIIIVSVDLNGGPLKMVSFQRDLYVAIPGYGDDRLNSAYAYGGAKLMVETLEKNFGVDIDSYVKVDFDGFESIIDKLGGLRISLTARESEYLNTTKYISKPEQRNTVAGYQNLTGNQVLGYCRVRYVPTAEGLKDDIGRNYRHRVVLKAIFEKYKEKSLGELLSIMGQCFDYVTVESNLEKLAVDCLAAVIENKMFEIDTLQMPKNGASKGRIINGKDIVIYDLLDIDMLQEFLYGEEE